MSEIKKKLNPFITKHPLSQLKLMGLRQIFKILNILSPALGARLALRVFLTPPRHPIPSWQKPYIATAIPSILLFNQKNIRIYEWGKGELMVLLVHGWGGRGTQLGAFIDPLVRAGYRVIAFDGPAQGDSTGKRSDMFEFAALINKIIHKKGPCYAVIGHSFGAACSLLALHQFPISITKLILIGCPSSSIWITEDFATKLGISTKSIQKMRELVQLRYGNQWKWEKLLSLKYLFKKNLTKALIIHDENDKEVPYSHAIELQAVGHACQLLTTQNQGHRRILRHPEVIAKTVEFINH